MITMAECLQAGSAGVMIPNEDYHALGGISGTGIKLLAESQQHFNNRKLFDMGSTKALKMGNLVHTLTLEPDSFIDRYVVMPEFQGKAATGKTIADAISDFKIDHKDKVIVDNADYKKAQKMARNVRAVHPHLFKRGIIERSLFADADGLEIKSRLDIEIDGDDYDLKSISLGVKEFSNNTLFNVINRLKYHWSAAHRNIVRRTLGIPVRHTYLIFVDSGPGHMVRTIRISPDWIAETELFVAKIHEDRRWYEISHVDRTEIQDIVDKPKLEY